MKITHDYCQKSHWGIKPPVPIPCKPQGWAEPPHQHWEQVEMSLFCSQGLCFPLCPQLLRCHCRCDRSCLSLCSWSLSSPAASGTILSHPSSWRWFIQLHMGPFQLLSSLWESSSVWFQVLLFHKNRKKQGSGCISSVLGMSWGHAGQS